MFLKNKEQSYGKLLADSFCAIKPLLRKLLPVYILQFVLIFGLYYVASIFIFNDEFMALTDELVTIQPNGLEQTQQLTFISGLFDHFKGKAELAILYGLMIAITSFYLLIVLFSRGDGVLHEDQTKITQSWITGFKRFFPMIGFTLITFILGIAIYLVLAIIAIILYATLKDTAGAVFGIISTTVYLSFYIRFVLYAQALIMSRQEGIFNSIGKSLKLSEGYFWRLLGMLITVVCIPSAILVGIESYILVPALSSLPAGITNPVFLALNTIITILATTLLISGTYVFLNDSIHHQNTITNK